MIRKAILNDANAVYHIAKQNQLIDTKKQSSFLVSDFTIDDYKAFIQTLKHFYVYVNKDTVLGFLFAYEKDDLDLMLRVNQQIVHDAKNPFLVIKQVGIDPEQKRQGIGSKLYSFLMDKTDHDIYLAVTLVPYNKASMAFHKHMNFVQVFNVNEKDGIKRAIFYYDNPKTQAYYNETILLENYQTAKELYMHEDTLTWSKVNHLFYVTASLGAAIVIAANINTHNALYIGMLIVSIIGILASILFNIAIRSGLIYMQSRKAALERIEAHLKRHGGTEVLYIKTNKNMRRLSRSYTEYVLKALPLTLIAVWISVFIISLVSL
ncbi:MAG: N-acetyltransferase family protein [Bacillota bacterium]